MAVKVLIKKPSLTCSRGLPLTRAIVPNKLPNWAEKVNFNATKYSRIGVICKADFAFPESVRMVVSGVKPAVEA